VWPHGWSAGQAGITGCGDGFCRRKTSLFATGGVVGVRSAPALGDPQGRRRPPGFFQYFCIPRRSGSGLARCSRCRKALQARRVSRQCWHARSRPRVGGEMLLPVVAQTSSNMRRLTRSLPAAAGDGQAGRAAQKKASIAPHPKRPTNLGGCPDSAGSAGLALRA